jgi:hypothetical protein
MVKFKFKIVRNKIKQKIKHKRKRKGKKAYLGFGTCFRPTRKTPPARPSIHAGAPTGGLGTPFSRPHTCTLDLCFFGPARQLTSPTRADSCVSLARGPRSANVPRVQLWVSVRWVSWGSSIFFLYQPPPHGSSLTPDPSLPGHGISLHLDPTLA